MNLNANTKVYDRVINRAAMVRLYERRVNKKVDTVLDGHIKRLDRLLNEGSLKPEQQQHMFKAIEIEINKTFAEVNNTSQRSLFDLFSDQVSYAVQNVETAVGKIWSPERPPRRLAEDVILKNPLYADKTLLAGWSNISISERKRVEALIRRGIAENKTLNEIALLVRKENIHTISRSQSKGLVVTAVTSVASQADHAVYRANEKALAGWQYVAVLDARTTPVCAARDGHVYPLTNTAHLPPAHFHCRSTTTPVFKSWSDMAKLEGVANVRRNNLAKLSDKEKAFYDGSTPLRESYNDWLKRQDSITQLRHLGDYQKVDLFNKGALPLDGFTNDAGNSIGIKELRAMTDSGYTLPNDTVRFANAKLKLDSMQLGVTSPDDLYGDGKMRQTLLDYYKLQAGELDGTLSTTNYRGVLAQNKKATRRRVLSAPPTEAQLKFNPVTGRYEDVRVYQPSPGVLSNSYRLVQEASELLDKDKTFIINFVNDLEGTMSVNERAVVTENLRVTFTRYRKSPEPWVNFKAVTQGQIKFDVMNISDAIEINLRKDSDVLKKLLSSNYIDPVLGETQLQDLHDNFIANIKARNKWEDKVAPKIAKEMQPIFNTNIPIVLRQRIDEADINQFYLRFAHRLSLADTPDRDQLAVSLGRDLYNLAGLNGSRRKWYETGLKVLETKRVHKFFTVETFGVQKRRLKSKMSGAYFGPYYDTIAYNIRVVDPRIQEYAQLTRKVDLGLRVGVTVDKNKLHIREGYKTYFIDDGILGYTDTRIPITSTSSFSDFPEELIDKDMADALNWTGSAKYKIDSDFYDFTQKLLYFEDDKGKAKYYNDLNEYRKYISSRGDAYERFKAMSWLRNSGKSFSNHPFLDHRARIYDRGLIGPQSGESFRPFLNTAVEKEFSEQAFLNFQDQVGAFLGGISDKLEGRYNSLTFTGRQKIAEKWRSEMVLIGQRMLKAKPADIRAILESDLVASIDGEELGKFFRFAIEIAKIDKHLGGSYAKQAMSTLSKYKTALALEQDASSSGAQIIALTTRNKTLAELSNVVPTTQKRRLYDEIAAATYNDPRFRKLNEKLGLSEKDLRKAAKAQNMVTFYGAGERTGILNVEGKLSKVLGKDGATLVVKASDRDTVLNEISARIARVERYDALAAEEMRDLRQSVRDIFNKGLSPGDDIMEQLYFLEPKTKDLLEKMTASYDRIVTPSDFKEIAQLMSEQLELQVPILKDFTKFFGRLAEEFLNSAKPSNSNFDWKTIAKLQFLRSKGKDAAITQVLQRFKFWKPGGTLDELINGVASPDARRVGARYLKYDIAQLVDVFEIEVFKANKLPKSWTNIPWVNFDGKTIEQNFTQSFEERIVYKDAQGQFVTNIVQVPQKTEATWWEQLINKSGKINDIADATKARTAFAVNGNHSNDATFVKQFHLWGKEAGIPTSTIHDAFFANTVDMVAGREALRKIYARSLNRNVIRSTLDEMKARGMPKAVYDKYLEEAIMSGLIPIPGKSRIGGKLLKESDILKPEDVLQKVPSDFKHDYGWYGVG